MLEWLLYQIPWWVYLILALIVVGLLHRTIGLRNALVGAGLAAAAIFHVRARQQGWRDREQKGQKDAQEIIDRAARARRDADLRNADADRLRDDDGYRRD